MIQNVTGPHEVKPKAPGAQKMEDIDEVLKDIILKKVDAFNEYRRGELLTIKANIAYLCGHQDIQVVNGEIQPVPARFRVSVIANKILPAVINDIAVSTKISPKFDIVPAGTDEDDKATSKAGSKILPYLQRINDPYLYRQQAVLWYDIAGVGWRKVYWDPFASVIGRNPMPDEEGHIQELPPGSPIFQGEVRVEHVPNNELIFDNRIKNLRRLPWIIHHKTITLAEARQRYGDEKVSMISPSEVHASIPGKDSFEVEVMGDFSALSKAITSPNNKPKENALFEDDKLVNYYEFWHLPSASIPMGCFVVLVGDAIMVNMPYPLDMYPHGELPFVPACPMSLDGIMNGSIPRISQARPLQREYNTIRSMILDGSDAMGNSVFMVPRGGNLDFKKINNANGVYVEYDGPYKPTREQGVPIPATLFAHLSTVASDLAEIFSFHEASKGMMPEGGPRSAIGLQVLQEADNTQLSPMVSGFDKADERIAYQMLCLSKNYGERLINIVGKDNQWAVEKINPEEMRGKINVIVRTGSSLPINKTLEQERAFMVWQSGLLGNPQDPSIRRYVLKIMDLGGFDALLQDNAKDVNFAQKEFIQAEKMAMSMPPLPEDAPEQMVQEVLGQFVFVPPPNAFDDDWTHITEHGTWLKDKYWDYIGSGQLHLQILAQAMLMHVQMHQQKMAMQQMAAAAMQDPKSQASEKEPKSESGGSKKDKGRD